MSTECVQMCANKYTKIIAEICEKVLDKRGWRWYYIEAVREGSKIMPKTREIWRNLGKISDR